MNRDNARVIAAMLFMAGALGCFKSAPPAPPPVPESVSVTLRAVDLDGHPIAGMIPIATLKPNAFDEPLARGAPSADDGASVLAIPAGRHLYLRMWDPALKKFANNFFEVQPDGHPGAETMDIAMVPGASLEMDIDTPGTAVDIMMLHSREGPWWPAREISDATGHVRFGAVPAGIYSIRVKTQDGASAELAEVRLPPGGAVNLGRIPLNRTAPAIQ